MLDLHSFCSKLTTFNVDPPYSTFRPNKSAHSFQRTRNNNSVWSILVTQFLGVMFPLL